MEGRSQYSPSPGIASTVSSRGMRIAVADLENPKIFLDISDVWRTFEEFKEDVLNVFCRNRTSHLQLLWDNGRPDVSIPEVYWADGQKHKLRHELAKTGYRMYARFHDPQRRQTIKGTKDDPITVDNANNEHHVLVPRDFISTSARSQFSGNPSLATNPGMHDEPESPPQAPVYASSVTVRGIEGESSPMQWSNGQRQDALDNEEAQCPIPDGFHTTPESFKNLRLQTPGLTKSIQKGKRNTDVEDVLQGKREKDLRDRWWLLGSSKKILLGNNGRKNAMIASVDLNSALCIEAKNYDRHGIHCQKRPDELGLKDIDLDPDFRPYREDPEALRCYLLKLQEEPVMNASKNPEAQGESLTADEERASSTPANASSPAARTPPVQDSHSRPRKLTGITAQFARQRAKRTHRTTGNGGNRSPPHTAKKPRPLNPTAWTRTPTPNTDYAIYARDDPRDKDYVLDSDELMD